MFARLRASLYHAFKESPRRRPRRCVPSVSGATSCLEDRVLLSGVGGSEHVAHLDHRAANHRVDARTDARLASGDHNLRRDVSARVAPKS